MPHMNVWIICGCRIFSLLSGQECWILTADVTTATKTCKVLIWTSALAVKTRPSKAKTKHASFQIQLVIIVCRAVYGFADL